MMMKCMAKWTYNNARNSSLFALLCVSVVHMYVFYGCQPSTTVLPFTALLPLTNNMSTLALMTSYFSLISLLLLFCFSLLLLVQARKAYD